VIHLPERWIAETAIDTVVYANPERTIQVRYRMRVAPLRRVQSVVDEALASVSAWHTTTVAPRERFVTHEGEYAFAVACEGTWLGQPARRLVGIAYADDYMNTLDSISLGAGPPDPRPRVLLHSVSMHLGTRRRRYFYASPPGWHGHATGLVTHWFPAQFPARPATIVVYPANPTHEEPQAVFDAVIAHQQAMGAELTSLASPDKIVSKFGLEGQHWRVVVATPRGPQVHRDLVVFVRRSYTYALQLDTARASDDDARAVFLSLAATVEPVPQGGLIGSTDGTAHSAFAHFT